MLSQGLALMPSSTGQSSTSACPSNDILHATFYGGGPTTFNALGTYNYAGYEAAFMQYLSGGYPIPSPSGIPLNYTTVVDNIATNSNYTQWTFHIRPGTKWSDGTNVTSQDYVATWSKSFALDPSYDPVGISAEVVSVTAINNSAVQFQLNQSDAHFSEKISPVLGDPVLYPQSFASQGGNYSGIPTVNGKGDGPFYVASYSPGASEMIMLRNPYYNPLPKVCELDINFVESQSDAANDLAGGSSDLAAIPPSAAASLLGNPKLHIYTDPALYETYLRYNVTVYPYNMTAFRQALLFSINESALVQQAFAGYGIPADSAEGGVSNISTLYNPQQAQYSFDQGKALSLLSSIGITKGSDGFLHYPNGTQVSLTIWADNAITQNSLSASVVQTDLQQVGFKINLQLASYSTIIGYAFSNTNGIDQQIILHTTDVGYPGDILYNALPGPLTTVLVPLPGPLLWEWPQSVQNQFQGNLTALESTNNVALEKTYLNNIQALNAEDVPVALLAYGDNLYAYSTSHFTNWPTPYLYLPYSWNMTGLTQLSPVTSSSVSSSSNYLLYIGIAVVVVVIIIAAAVIFMRRK
jgi:ABC-type transport system substrate-binding protein